ncbi:MAG: sugar transferase [Marinifilaceae bacterium]|nr:sugar transferase [Marinifilaceae bacterium]
MYRHFFKRFLDIVVSLVALPFVLLVIICVAPFIYFTDRGPVFYNAKRAGKNGKPFKMFKFRSMYVNSPDLRNADGSTFNSNEDPRVTPVGRFLRKTSIDEIPQLLNVLIGDMSFVGPRPILASKSYTDYDEVLRKRSLVRPGITGYAQAYFRNSISQQKKYELDCYYVTHLSFLLDIRILYQTVISVVREDNVFVENK